MIKASRMRLQSLTLYLALAALAACATAQDQAKPAPPAPAPAAAAPAPAAVSSAWTDPEYERVANLITGTWKSSAPVQVGEDSFEVVMSVAPVACQGMTDTLYAEVARADGIDRPYRQAVWQLHRQAGKLRLKTMEFRRPRGELLSALGTWAAPEAFPAVSGDDLVTTLDIELASLGGGYMGKTPYPYPTSAGGASEMISEVSFDAQTLKSADRGFGADGNVVWGPPAGQSYAFAKIQSPVKVDRFEGNVISITYPSALEGEPGRDGMQVSCNYIGALANGAIFDTSYDRGEPFRYDYSRKLVPGWTSSMKDVQRGMKRRMIIPGPMGYGDQGNRQARIPGNATLYFYVDVLDITPAPTPPPAPQSAPQPQQQPQPPTQPQSEPVQKAEPEVARAESY